MEIEKNYDGSSLLIALTGRLDTLSAPELDVVIKTALIGVKSLVLDFSGVDYVSSAGLRVLLSAQKMMNKQGKMLIRNVSRDIQEVFRMTGFDSIFTIETPAG
ncbi:STAS domain-containing protein [Oxalobacter sp. OttesenSCG-928-P03]|nr:STAS domain-containing protein [Oxalobacter sp. OttesenSCG-928-P03]